MGSFFISRSICGYFGLVLFFPLKTLVISSLAYHFCPLCKLLKCCPYHSFYFLLSPIELYFCHWHFRFFTSFKNLPCSLYFLNYSISSLSFFSICACFIKFALIGNQTLDTSVHGTTLQLSHTRQGSILWSFCCSLPASPFPTLQAVLKHFLSFTFFLFFFFFWVSLFSVVIGWRPMGEEEKKRRITFRLRSFFAHTVSSIYRDLPLFLCLADSFLFFKSQSDFFA